MICLENVKRFCKEYWKIENYQEAVNDTTQSWDCHHRHEIDWDLPKEELIAIGRYYDVHYSELIFLTHAEHTRIHHKGKFVSEQSKQKNSESHKGQKPWNKGLPKELDPRTGTHRSEETKAKISNSKKGVPKTEAHKTKLSIANTKYQITKEELYDLYIVQGLSQRQIADLYGCGVVCIWNKLKKHNIKK